MTSGLIRYGVRRTIQAAFIFCLMTLMLSAVANVRYEVIDRTELQWQVKRSMGPILAQLPDLTAEERDRLVEEQLAAALEAAGMGDPLWVRILRRTAQILRFDFGESVSHQRTIRGFGGQKSSEVGAIIWESLLPTGLLFGGAFAAQIALALLLGLRNARRPGSIVDRGTTVIGLATQSVPTMVFAMLMVSAFVVGLRVFPSDPWVYRFPEGISEVGPWLWDFVTHYTLPFLTLVAIGLGGWAYAFRNLVIGTLQEDFIVTARARGLPERRVLMGHGVRATAPPIVTCVTYGFVYSLWGSFFVEPAFQWPGVGGLYLASIRYNDFTLFFGISVTMTAMYLAATLALDLVYGLLDPRIKVAKSAARLS